jgi:hypothetical protein
MHIRPPAERFFYCVFMDSIEELCGRLDHWETTARCGGLLPNVISLAINLFGMTKEHKQGQSFHEN